MPSPVAYRLRGRGWLLLLALLAGCAKPPQSTDRVTVVYQQHVLAARDARAPLWQRVPVYEATLEPQQIIAPSLEEPGVASMQVRAVHDGQSVVFRLSWADATQDLLAALGRFSDAVAIQLPAAEGSDLPEFAMGSPEHAVIIHQWKAVWQEAEAGRLTGIRSFYPNTWSDGYLSDFARPTERAALERAFTASQAAENPLARMGTAVRDSRAEGFGTLEIDHEQSTQGTSIWKNGEWVVTMIRPLARANAALVPGQHTYLALAVWNGSHAEVGARKMVTAWIPVEVEPTP